MIRRLFNVVTHILEWLLLIVDGHTPTMIRIKAVRVPMTPPRTRISRDRAAMSHHCAIPWGQLAWHGGSWQCPLCRSVYTYLQLPRREVTQPHHVVSYRQRKQYGPTEVFKEYIQEHMEVVDGHLAWADKRLIDTGKLFKPTLTWRT